MVLKIDGMKCIHCSNRVIKGLTDAGATNVIVSYEKGEASFDNLDRETAIEVIEDLGFEVIG